MRDTALRGYLTRTRLSTIALAVGLLAGGSGAAWAQDDQSAGDAAKSDGSPIIVTGSRVAKSTFDTTSPVTVLNSQDVEKLNLIDVGEIVAQMPSNSNFFAANNVGLGNFNVGAQLVNLRGLNPFFGTRTLTLVDTRRVVPTTTGGGVDVTLIPSMLVDRTETVTGGASAIYGSDAVAGVVNIILDTKLDGLKAQADFSRTTHGDGNVWHGSAAWGTGFADGKGHIVIGGEYQKTDSIGICSTERDWCSSNYGMFTNNDYATNGQPHYIIGPNATSANTSLTGVLTQCEAFFGLCAGGPQLQFNQDGSALVPYDPGKYASGAGFFGFRQGGDDQAVGAYDTTTLRPEVTRWSTLAHLTYELAPSVTAFIEGSYARSEAVIPVANGAIGPYAFVALLPNLYTGSHIVADNAFLTPAEAAFVGPNGANFGRNMVNVQTARNETNNSTWRVVGGLDGNFGNRWNWELYYEHGENKNDQHLYHNVVSTFLNYALDAVDDGSGNIVCGVNIPGRINPNTGAPYSAADVAAASSGGACVPLNLFGTGNVSQAAVDYAFRTLVEFSTYKQDVASLNVNGDLFDGFGAGAVKLATGLEYRHEYGIVTHDLANQPWYNNYTLSYGLDYAGSIDVLEGYGELNVPVFRDSPVGKYFELDGAVRYTTNKAEESLGPQTGESKRHDFVTWKISGIWDVTDWLRLRATRSRDVRAAQFRELFQSYNVTAGGPFGSVANPWPGGSSSDAANITTGGDVNLRPEVANTITAGIVLSPNKSLRFSADWYQIDLSDAIVGPPFGLGAQNIVTQCFQGVQEFCDRMTGEGTADILTIDNTAVNLQGFTTRGIDFEGVYALQLNETSSLNFRVLASLLYDQLFSTGLGTPPVNYAGQSGPTAAFGSFNTAPKWQGNAFVTYNTGPFTGTVQVRYIGPGRFLTQTAAGGEAIGPDDPGYSTTDPNSISDNHVDSAVYVNISASYDITQNVSLFGSINNLFEKDPVIAPGGNGYPTNPVYFDTYGRTWRAGVRVKM
jgi:outer membrane receptor protein involved in Fe transport